MAQGRKPSTEFLRAKLQLYEDLILLHSILLSSCQKTERETSDSRIGMDCSMDSNFTLPFDWLWYLPTTTFGLVLICLEIDAFLIQTYAIINAIALLDPRINLVYKMHRRGNPWARILQQVQSILVKVSQCSKQFSHALDCLDPLFDDTQLDDVLVECRKYGLNMAGAVAASSVNRVDLVQDIFPDLPNSFLKKWCWYMYQTKSKLVCLTQIFKLGGDRMVQFHASTILRELASEQLDDNSADLVSYLLLHPECQPADIQHFASHSVQLGLSRQLQIMLNSKGKVDIRRGAYAFDPRDTPMLTELVYHACLQRDMPQTYPKYANFTACLSFAVRHGLFTEPIPHRWDRKNYRLQLEEGQRHSHNRSDEEPVMGTAVSAAALYQQTDIVTLLHKVGAATNKEMHQLSQYHTSRLKKQLSACSLAECPKCQAARDMACLMSKLAGTPRSLLRLTAQVISSTLVGQGHIREDKVHQLPLPTYLKKKVMFEDALTDFLLAGR